MPQTPNVEKHLTASETVRDIVMGVSDGLTASLVAVGKARRAVNSLLRCRVTGRHDAASSSGIAFVSRSSLARSEAKCSASILAAR